MAPNTRVFAIEITPPLPDVLEVENHNDVGNNEEIQEERHDQIEEEKALQEAKANKRNQTFKDIMLNKTTEYVSLFTALYGFTGLLLVW